MRHLYLAMLLSLGAMQMLNAQSPQAITKDDICRYSSIVGASDSITEFKDSIKLTIELSEVYVGKDTKSVNFFHTEIFTNESTIIKVNEDMAIRVSIGRVINNGEKCYLYSIHLFKKDTHCWKPIDAFGTWDIGKLGNVNAGLHYGTKGEDCFGYQGEIILE